MDSGVPALSAGIVGWISGAYPRVDIAKNVTNYKNFKIRIESLTFSIKSLLIYSW